MPAGAGLLSARRKHRAEGVGMLAGVVPEAELVEVEREVLPGDVVEAPHDATLQQRPERVQVRGVDDAPNVLAFVVIHGLMREADVLEARIAEVLVGRDERHFAGHSAARELIHLVPSDAL